MKTGILCVGTELLIGKTLNTNSAFLSEELNLLGFDVIAHHTVGDNPQRLTKTISQLFDECDLIVTTGGLGPTQDDLTKEVICNVMGEVLISHPESMGRLEARFKQTGREMTANNLKQAYLPSRGQVFQNNHGTAPGFAIEKNGKMIVALPGPPREMKSMFEEGVKQFLEKYTQGILFFRDLRTYGIGESALETKLLDLISEQSDPTIATYAKEGECYLRIASKKAEVQEARETVDKMVETIVSRIGKYIYSKNGEDLVEVVFRELLKKGWTISSAESCTGGLFSGRIIDVAGASSVFKEGFITYSNESKTKILGVSNETLETYGAVSEEVAIEMVQGLSKISDSHINIAITGIAGPEGGSDKKPVGLAYIGLKTPNGILVSKIQGRNVSRTWNRNYFVLAMLNLVRLQLEVC